MPKLIAGAASQKSHRKESSAEAEACLRKMQRAGCDKLSGTRGGSRALTTVHPGRRRLHGRAGAGVAT